LSEASTPPGGWRARLRGVLRKTREGLGTPVGELLRRQGPAEEVLEDLEEALIAADVGVDTTMTILEGLRSGSRRAGPEEMERSVRRRFLEILHAGGRDASPALSDGEGGSVPAGAERPWTVLLVGVNGTGKTTTAARLAWRARREGEEVVLAAADTFRAAAIEQLEEWGRRAEVPVIRHQPGADPAAVLYDAISSARARGAGLVLADTAGRSHTRSDLMEELAKMGRVAGKEVPGAPHEVLVVLDATTGQNGLQQVRGFAGVLPLTGLVLTKMDGTARGGIALAAVGEMGLPIRWVGLGEGLEDLVPFDPEAYVDGLFL